MHSPSFFKSPKGLNLTSVDFHPTPDASRERSQLDRLSQRRAAEALSERPVGAGERPFVLLDGPPYANGLAHAGHLLNRSLKDFAARAHALGGERVEWRPGWDCHGLPLELAVEKRHGADVKKDPVLFARLAREEAMLWSTRQEDAFRRLGTLSDWSRPWRTMDPAQESRALALALELFEEGLLAPASAPVHWCAACGSSLAASELEPLAHARLETAFVAFLDEKSARALLDRVDWLPGFARAEPEGRSPLSLSVGLPCWTSAPWTLWGSAAYAFEAGCAMSLARRGDGSWLVAPEAALPAVRQAAGEALPVAAVCPGDLFASLALFAQRPLGPGLNPLLAGPRDVARAEDGLGWTHLAPAHGPEDHAFCEPLGLSALSCVGENGRASAALAQADRALAGLSLGELAAQGAARLEQDGRLLWKRSARHEGQGCWRHKTPFFFREARQWFLDLDRAPRRGGMSLRDAALAANASVRWLPEGTSAGAQMESMLRGRDRWCVSRSRLWGLPLPLHKDAQGQAHPDSARLWREFLPRAAQLGALEAWSQETSPEGFEKEAFCLDVWFDSGAVFETVLGAQSAPASLMSEGRDQTRGWFLSSFLLNAWKRGGQPPAEAVFCHGFCLGEDGKKLSKSNGGGAPVADLFEKWGADTLRLWAALSEAGADPALTAKALEGAKKELRSLKMALRFALMNAEAPADRTPAALRPLDALFLREWAHVEREALALARRGRFEASARELTAFCKKASSQWFDASKNTLYLEPLDSLARQSAAWALGAFFERLAPLSSLFLAFSAEEAWEQWRQKEPESNASEFACLASLGWAGPSGGVWGLAQATPWSAAAEEAQSWRSAHGGQAEREREAARGEVGLSSPLAGALRAEGFSPEGAGRLLGVSAAFGEAESLPEGWVAAAEAPGEGRWLRAPAAACPRCRRRLSLAPGRERCDRCETQLSGQSAMSLLD